MQVASSTDFVVVGAGIAGLRAAISLAEAGRVLVVTKEALGESNTSYAQGGIAVAMSGPEDVELHLEDTIAAGDGLVDVRAARVLVEEGPVRVEELLAWGTGFDRKGGRLMLTREGAHSRNRILHANGDATGAEIGRSLLAHARGLANIELAEWTTCVDLVERGGEVLGIVLLDRGGSRCSVQARAVLLASGGAGQVYSDTTNPAVATGDGIAMAYRAGAEIADMEFYQFHPTAISMPGLPRFLLSEALRGEGAHLRNGAGERFMERYHPLLELAPRDVVARAITREGLAGEEVFLDMRHVKGLDLRARFPGISAFLAQHGLALAEDRIPVRPAAHYLMGGVRTGLNGRASLKRLYAAGEVACTGVHGANRLASNSLLEGLVFGARAAAAMREERAVTADGTEDETENDGTVAGSGASAAELLRRLQTTMWQDAGLLRDGEGLERAAAALEAIEAELPKPVDRSTIELTNLLQVGGLIVGSALARRRAGARTSATIFPGGTMSIFAGTRS